MKSRLIILCALSFAVTGCMRVVVEGRDRPIEPISRSFSHSVPDTYEAAKKALTLLGYEVREDNPKEHRLRTGWDSTKAVSHYTELFGQKDYGTVGSYYRLEVRVSDQEGKTQIEVASPVKSLAGHQRSSYREEKKLLKKVEDLLRRDDFKITNVGAE